MARRRPFAKAGLFASTCLALSSISGIARAQVLLDQNIPDPNLGYGADYLRRGSGYGSAPETVAGQDTVIGTTVLTRPHPEYDPQGYQFGKFQINLDGSEGAGYDSNPFGLTNAKGSGYNETQGTATAAGTWNNFGVTSRLTVDNFRYWSLPTLDHTDWTAYVGGYYDIGIDRVQASYTHLALNVLPTGVDVIGVTNQVIPFTDDEVRLSYAKQLGRFTVIPDASYSIYRFGNGNGGTANGIESAAAINDETANNRNVGQVGLTTRYELSPGKDIIGVIRFTDAQFMDTPTFTINQNYLDYQFLAGLDVQTQGKFRYRALIGYETRQFQASGASSQSSPAFEGQVIWVPTQLTTVTLTANRLIADAVGGGAQSFKYTTGRIQVDHEARRNLILTAFGQIQAASYQANLSATVYDFGVKATYRFNRHLALILSEEYLDRSSNNTQLNHFNESISLLTLRVSL